MYDEKNIFYFAISLLILVIYSDAKIISAINPNNVVLINNETSIITLKFRYPLNDTTTLIFVYSASDTNYTFNEKHKIVLPLSNVTLAENISEFNLHVTALNVGSIIVGFLTNESDIYKLEDIFMLISVIQSRPLMILINIIGWIYFFAWSISFYPQVFTNWNRKSVVGLNFDFVFFNLTGFFAYSVFNIALFWIPAVKNEYHNLHPLGVNPVQANDVAFSVHAFILTAITLLQCVLYERGSQRVSYTCRALLAVAWLFALVTLIITLSNVITWLMYVTYLSYIKLAITLIKYVPQAFMNFRRKTTDGWSIGNVLLDFTGGSLSLLQMFLITYNNDDWSSIFGDPTKFGLGMFSILFDILFITQHYCLYRKHNSSLAQILETSVNAGNMEHDLEQNDLEDQRLLD